jgi:hypothetical protein
VRILLPLAILLFLVGCATPPRVTLPATCNDKDFASPAGLEGSCKKMVCVDGKPALVDDVFQTAPVDDWAEEKYCAFHLVNCTIARDIKKKVVKWTEGIADAKTYWDRKSLHNGAGDAARHLYAGCLLAQELGPAAARDILNTHEEDSGHELFGKKGETGNPCCEKLMDLYNNEIGISLATRPGTCEDKVLAALPRSRYSVCPPAKPGENGKNPVGPTQPQPGGR